MLNYADNAVMAKVRALYGQRLTEGDYAQLLASKSVADVASYLKNNTYYSGMLVEVKEELIHRGQLESLIRRRNLSVYMRLLKYSHNDRFFVTIYMKENEIRQLLLAIRFLNANSMDRYIIALPAYLSKFMSFDLFALAAVRKFDDLLDVIAHSPYRDIVAQFRPISAGRPVDILGCERALMEHHYKAMLAAVERDYFGDTKKELQALFYSKINYHNLMVAFRLKRYFAYTADRVRDAMLDIATDLNPGLAYGGILAARDEGEVAAAMGDAYLARKFRLNLGHAGELLSIRLERSQDYVAHRTFRFSTKPVIVAIAYMFMLEVEVSNIVNIIEGIRYQVPPEEIRNLLVL